MPTPRESNAPLVQNANGLGESTFGQLCCRYMAILVVAMVIGFLAGIGFSEGLVAMLITLGALVLLIIVILIVRGYGHCRADCVACFDLNRDGRITCHDCSLLCSQNSAAMFMTVVFGLICGAVAGHFVVA